VDIQFALQTAKSFSLEDYVQKISSHVEAVRVLCFFPWAGYIFDYMRMDLRFLNPENGDFELPWERFSRVLSTLAEFRWSLTKAYGKPVQDSITISFSKQEIVRLKKRWREKRRRETASIPLHADMQISKYTIESGNTEKS